MECQKGFEPKPLARGTFQTGRADLSVLKPLASGSLGGAMEFAILVQHSGPYTGLPCYLVGCSEFLAERGETQMLFCNCCFFHSEA